MIYDYIVSPRPRRLVFTAAGLPTVTLPVDPALFDDILDFVDAYGEASLSRLQHGLEYALDSLHSVHDRDAKDFWAMQARLEAMVAHLPPREQGKEDTTP